MRRNSRRAREDTRARQQFRERLAALRQMFSYEGRQESAERLRRGAARAFLAHRGPGAWSRLLALEGPDSDAWLGLARAHAAGGAGEAALTCAAEAVRCGHAPEALVPEIARLGLGSRAGAEGLPSGTPAAVVAEVFAATPDDPTGLGALYQALAQAELAYVLRALLLRRLFTRIGDSEELARQRERLGTTEVVDPHLGEWLVSAWMAMLPEGRAAAGTALRPPGTPSEALEHVRRPPSSPPASGGTGSLPAPAEGQAPSPVTGRVGEGSANEHHRLVAGPGGTPADLEALRERALAGDGAAVAGWLLEGSRLGELEERPDRPEAAAALAVAVRLPPGQQAEPFNALAVTFATPSERWLAVVEHILDDGAARLDPGLLPHLLDLLAAAHRQAAIQGWLEAYRRQVSDWVETLWPPTGPATS